MEVVERRQAVQHASAPTEAVKPAIDVGRLASVLARVGTPVTAEVLAKYSLAADHVLKTFRMDVYTFAVKWSSDPRFRAVAARVIEQELRRQGLQPRLHPEALGNLIVQVKLFTMTRREKIRHALRFAASPYAAATAAKTAGAALAPSAGGVMSGVASMVLAKLMPELGYQLTATNSYASYILAGIISSMKVGEHGRELVSDNLAREAAGK